MPRGVPTCARRRHARGCTLPLLRARAGVGREAMRIANAQSSRPAGGGRLFAFGLALGLALALAWPACAATVCNVRDHGARGDGKTLDTAAILACLGDQVPTVVLLPAPGRYLSAPFNLSSSTTLRVQSGATLLASDNASLWPVVADLPSYPRPVENDGNMTGRYAPFIGTDSHAHDVTIDGGGTIDGQGLAWWFRRAAFPATPRLFCTRAAASSNPCTALGSPFATFPSAILLLDNPPVRLRRRSH